MDPYLTIIVRSVVVYVFIILAIRLFGKKELSQLSIVDLVFILLLSNSVQSAMVGANDTLAGGLAAALGLFVANWVFKHMLYTSKRMSNLLQGGAILLVYKGHVNEEHLKKAEITVEELDAAVREHGVEHVRDVDLAMLEVDGTISVMSKDFTRRTMKKRRAHKSFSPRA